MRHACIVILAAGIIAAGAFVPSLAQEEEGQRVVKAVLRGFEEPPRFRRPGAGRSAARFPRMEAR